MLKKLIVTNVTRHKCHKVPYFAVETMAVSCGKCLKR